jgi:hypothetical protein
MGFLGPTHSLHGTPFGAGDLGLDICSLNPASHCQV